MPAGTKAEDGPAAAGEPAARHERAVSESRQLGRATSEARGLQSELLAAHTQHPQAPAAATSRKRNATRCSAAHVPPQPPPAARPPAATAASTNTAAAPAPSFRQGSPPAMCPRSRRAPLPSRSARVPGPHSWRWRCGTAAAPPGSSSPEVAASRQGPPPSIAIPPNPRPPVGPAWGRCSSRTAAAAPC